MPRQRFCALLMTGFVIVGPTFRAERRLLRVDRVNVRLRGDLLLNLAIMDLAPG